MAYADSDYRQCYSYGPINYKEASVIAAKENNNNPPRLPSRITSSSPVAASSAAIANAEESDMLWIEWTMYCIELIKKE